MEIKSLPVVHNGQRLSQLRRRLLCGNDVHTLLRLLTASHANKTSKTTTSRPVWCLPALNSRSPTSVCCGNGHYLYAHPPVHPGANSLEICPNAGAKRWGIMAIKTTSLRGHSTTAGTPAKLPATTQTITTTTALPPPPQRPPIDDHEHQP